jgi:hypothetical protein
MGEHFSHECWQAFHPAFSPTLFDSKVLAFDPAKLAQSIPEYVDPVLMSRG